MVEQFYHYDVNRWLNGDPAVRHPSRTKRGQKSRIGRIFITRMSFRCPINGNIPGTRHGTSHFIVSLLLWSIRLRQEQLILLLREWYMHPNGQLPAYEWAFGDVNPPFMHGLRGVFTKSSKNAEELRDRNFWNAYFINCC